jgi:uncharacterized membrane protein YozB (DUF420 family)
MVKCKEPTKLGLSVFRFLQTMEVIFIYLTHIFLFSIVTCISKQRTDKHLATKYTHATIELRMLLLVARQQSARQLASEVTIT